MTSPSPSPSAASAPLRQALRHTRRFTGLFYLALALLLTLLSAVPALLTPRLPAAAQPVILLLTPLLVLPSLFVPLWRRRVVLHRLRVVADALRDGRLLARSQHGSTLLSELDGHDGSSTTSLSHLSKRLASLSEPARVGDSTPLLSCVTNAPLDAALRSLENHPVLQLHGLLSRLFRTLALIVFVYPVIPTALAGAAWLLSLRTGSVAINIVGAVSGGALQLATYAVRRRVLRLVTDAVELLVDEELERRETQLSGVLMHGAVDVGDD